MIDSKRVKRGGPAIPDFDLVNTRLDCFIVHFASLNTLGYSISIVHRLHLDHFLKPLDSLVRLLHRKYGRVSSWGSAINTLN